MEDFARLAYEQWREPPNFVKWTPFLTSLEHYSFTDMCLNMLAVAAEQPLPVPLPQPPIAESLSHFVNRKNLMSFCRPATESTTFTYISTLQSADDLLLDAQLFVRHIKPVNDILFLNMLRDAALANVQQLLDMMPKPVDLPAIREFSLPGMSSPQYIGPVNSLSALSSVMFDDPRFIGDFSAGSPVLRDTGAGSLVFRDDVANSPPDMADDGDGLVSPGLIDAGAGSPPAMADDGDGLVSPWLIDAGAGSPPAMADDNEGFEFDPDAIHDFFTMDGNISDAST